MPTVEEIDRAIRHRLDGIRKPGQTDEYRAKRRSEIDGLLDQRNEVARARPV